MIVIKNRVRTIPADIKRLKKDARIVLDAAGYGDFDLSILLTTNKTIREYNRKYRKKDVPTDILSFPYYSDLKPGQRIKVNAVEEKNLGDIIISLEHAKKDTQQLGVSLKKRLQQLLVHGICHLIGYKHGTEEEYQRMQKKEQFLLSQLD